MADFTVVAAWLNAYSEAWRTYDPRAIGNLFTDDAAYYFGPYDEPVRGRDAIVANWLEHRDAPGTYEGRYVPLAVEGDLTVANGRSRYFESDGATLKTEFDNIFVMRFDGEGRCTEFREWFMERPKR